MCSRVTLRSESLLDNILVNVKYDFADVILNDVSDHFGVLFVIREFGVPIAMIMPAQMSALKMDAEALSIFRRKIKNTNNLAF
jgi:orotate phosphoribosyltransferase-like protein